MEYTFSMSKLRKIRLESAIKREVSEYLHEMDDPRLRKVVITYVDVSKDFHYAKIYFTVMEKDKNKEVWDALLHASKKIQKDIAYRLRTMRYIPLISFHLDLSIQKGNRVLDILDKVEEELKEKGEDDKSITN